MSADRLLKLSSDLIADGKGTLALDFNSVTVSFGVVPAKDATDNLIVTLSFDYSPFLHHHETGIRGFVRVYCDFASSFISSELDDSHAEPPYSANAVAGALAGLWKAHMFDKESRLVMLIGYLREYLNPNPNWNTAQSSNLTRSERRKAYRPAILWLCDHESDPQFKQFFADVLKEFDALTAESAK